MPIKPQEIEKRLKEAVKRLEIVLAHAKKVGEEIKKRKGK